jgi:hypothetical protein
MEFLKFKLGIWLSVAMPTPFQNTVDSVVIVMATINGVIVSPFCAWFWKVTQQIRIAS